MNRKLQGERNKVASRLVVVLTCLWAKKTLNQRYSKITKPYRDGSVEIKIGSPYCLREFRKIYEL
jgi:hypothetical protein